MSSAARLCMLCLLTSMVTISQPYTVAAIHLHSSEEFPSVMSVGILCPALWKAVCWTGSRLSTSSLQLGQPQVSHQHIILTEQYLQHIRTTTGIDLGQCFCPFPWTESPSMQVGTYAASCHQMSQITVCWAIHMHTAVDHSGLLRAAYNQCDWQLRADPLGNAWTTLSAT